MTFDAHEMDVVALLQDATPFLAPFGGARSVDETNVEQAGFGPGGYVESGRYHRKGDVPGLRRSLRLLSVALAHLRREDFPAWASLINPYLADEADPGVIPWMRERVREHDAENEKRKKRGQQPRVACVHFRRELEKHDRAIRKLARMLEGHRLEPVHAAMMSSREREAGEKANREVLAYYRRLKSYGRTHRGAVAACAHSMSVSEDEIERILEFREEISPDTCVEPDCDRKVYQQHRCQRCYARDYRARRRAG